MPNNTTTKRARSRNWKPNDWDVLVDSVLSFRNVLFPMAGISVANQEKGRAWGQILEKFNNRTGKNITKDKISRQWRTLQRNVRARQTDSTVMSYMCENFFDKLKSALLEYSAPLTNRFDSDFGHHRTVLTTDRRMLLVDGNDELSEEHNANESNENDRSFLELSEEHNANESNENVGSPLSVWNDDDLNLLFRESANNQSSENPINHPRYTGTKNKEPSRQSRYRKIENEVIMKLVEKDVECRTSEHKLEVKRLRLSVKREQLAIKRERAQLRLVEAQLAALER